MLFTPAGLEQATRTRVARWRAERFRDAGVRRVWDLGCGIGSDAMAFAEAGLDVVAVDADPTTVAVASHNLALVGAGPARLGRAEDARPGPHDAVFLDPARRTARGRTWRVADLTPPWDVVRGHLDGPGFVAVKLGPGVPKEVLPVDAEWCWVSDAGDVVEASVWNRVAGRRAVRLGDGDAKELRSTGAELEVAPIGAFVGEPDGAALRAGLLAEAAGEGAWRLAPGLGYVSSDAPVATGWVTNFRVLDVLPHSRKALARYVREHDVGRLEIKQRGFDVDPAVLRRALKPRGSRAATILLAHTTVGARAIVAERVVAG
ncbi:THUMP-like domain-containing protein [uncultured Tessaracoccus sp.]|uniref:class I SAM-dependent methyltransferase n=1 Tax=uncultured Tessaracoccus sp. TaxID=905023 RepID=UPI0025F7AC55|nr:methyltransferase domain-containing protein [uncultured Tessaracoccus sp.]